ncbi:MAG: type II secretion system inner membrane protein GspF, partial [Betaproteobacteria bacterium]|nr:type II secretion system inner membrane protein GspF [Betaproteobacteria bacterium]
MEAFHYRALNAAGRTVSGVMQADTPRQVRMQLRAQGLLPFTVEQVQSPERARQLWARGIAPAELSLVTRQLATLIDSGLTMEESLTALIEQASGAVAKEILTGVKAGITSGQSLAAALSGYPKSFPDFYCALVHGGEESGKLATVLQHLADYLDARQALKQKTGLALLYPILVSVIAVLIVTGLLVYVVPQIVQVFQQSRQSLPLLTRALIAASEFMRGTWPYLAAILIGALAAGRLALRRDAPRRRWHALLLAMPWLGPLIRGVNTSRFASTLAILVGGGVPLLTALASGARVMTNMVMKKAIEDAIERVREGASLARSLGASRVFPPLLVHLIASGEVSGKLEQMLERAADLETQSLERRLAVFLTVLEPAMILAMGGIVLLIVLAILLPIIEINQLV